MLRICCVLLVCFLSPITLGQTTTTTYQGRLVDNGVGLDGAIDVHIALFREPTGGLPLAIVTDRGRVPVSSGLFQVLMEVPRNSRVGDERFLEISVRRTGDPTFVTLTPRQRLLAPPEAGDAPGARIEPDRSVVVRPDISEPLPAVDIASLSLGSTSQVFSSGIRQTFIAEATGEVSAIEVGIQRFANTGVVVRVRDSANNELGNAVLQQDAVGGSVLSVTLEPGVVVQSGESYAVDIVGLGFLGFAPVGVAITDAADPYADGEATSLDGSPPPAGDVALRVVLGDDVPEIRVNAGEGDPVSLPTASVQAEEIEGEAGIAFTDLFTGLQNELEDPSITIRAPADGQYLVIASGVLNTNTFTGPVIVGLSTVGPDGPNEFSHAFGNLLGGDTSADVPLYFQGIYPVIKDEEITVFFTQSGGNIPANVNEVQLTALFFPTNYSVASP